MESVKREQLPELFSHIAAVMAENSELLCGMDAAMGDGDLGLTMKKGFAALAAAIAASDQPEIGQALARSAMKMASEVPSTMGTLMSSGIMGGGKRLAGATEIGPAEYALFLRGFCEGVAKRGKCAAGERTLLDSLLPAAEAAEAAAGAGKSLAETASAALEGAKAGLEATKNMLPKYGKAVVHTAKALGVADQGAFAATLFIQAAGEHLA